jgi:ankyrin repeat protein
VDAPAGGVDGLPPLHAACWRGRAEAERALVEGGADIHAPNQFGGDALGSALHGSLNCHAPSGGMTMKLPGEVAHGDYPAVVELLIAAGARLPARPAGSDAVQDVLRRHGVSE